MIETIDNFKILDKYKSIVNECIKDDWIIYKPFYKIKRHHLGPNGNDYRINYYVRYIIIDKDGMLTMPEWAILNGIKKNDKKYKDKK